MMRTTCILLAIFVLTVSAGLNAAPARFSMYLKAHPQAIVADGRSETTISADVRDQLGKPVSDGTVVNFTSSVGAIERSAQTTAGVARVRLQSPAVVGTAMVSAVVENGNVVAQLRVDFLEPGTEMFSDSFITISSKKHLGYDVNERIVDSAGGVEIASRGLSISAEEAQIDLKTNILRAKCQTGGENIVLGRGEKRVEASAVYYDFNAMYGVLLTPASEGAKRMTFRGRDLYVEPATEDADQSRSLDFSPISEASMFIKASSMVIRPGEEVKFKRAVFYMDGSKMIKVPLYVVSLSGGSMGSGQMFSYGSAGLRLDVPFYYSLTPNSTGAVRLRRSESGGWGYYSDRPGWQLDVQQDYNYAGTTEGTFVLNRVTSLDDWGARWTNRTQFQNNSQVYSYIDFPSHRSLFGSTSYTRGFKGWTMSLNTRASKAANSSGTFATDAYFQTRSKPTLGGAFNYSFSTKLSMDTRNNDRYGTGIGVQLYSKPRKMGALGDLNTSLVAGQNWGMRAGPSMAANVGLSRMLGRFGTVGMNYSYTFYDQMSKYSAHQISVNLMVNPGAKWSAYANATKGLTDGTLSAFGSLSYQLAPTWRLDTLATYQKFGSYSYPDAQFALAKAIGRNDFSLIWSTSERRFRFEFSPLSF